MMTVGKLLDEFFAFNERDKKPKTQRFYRQRFRLFREEFGRRPISGKRAPTALEIQKHLHATARANHLSGSTQHHNGRAILTLQNWAIDLDLMETKWVKRLKLPPVARREKMPTKEEFEKIRSLGSPAFQLIYTALRQSGARPGELVSANIEFIHAKPRPHIRLTEHKTAGKTGEDRIILLEGGFALSVLQARGERTSGPLFLNDRGERWTVDRLSGLHRRLRDKAGCGKHVVLYCTRHEYVTTELNSGRPVDDVSLLVGHKDASTTRIYSHRTALDVKPVKPREDSAPPPDKPAEGPSQPPAAA